MGSFADYRGNGNIPEDKKVQFTEQMIRILDLGGMMGITNAKMFDYNIPLLRPVCQMTGMKKAFYYNYFEDQSWESAAFESEESYLWSGKIGDAEFSDVMVAAYMLYEAYDPEMGFAQKDGDFVEASWTLGWLNQILGTSFSIGKRKNIWSCIESVTDPEYAERLSENTLRDLIPYNWRMAAGGTDLADLLYIINGTAHLTEETVQQGTYPADVLKCRQELTYYFQKNTDPAPLWELLKKNYAERAQIRECDLEPIAQLSLRMPARVFLLLIAELRKENFWKIWETWSKEVYHDEQMVSYVSEELKKWREEVMQRPVPKVRTSDYLRQDGYFTFYDTPEELKGKPNYYLSDADRLFWWDGTEEVQITAETDVWLKHVAEQYQELVKTEERSADSIVSLRDFMKMLQDINEYYWNVFPFESMFYEFVEHISQKEYIAASNLIRKIAEDEENRKSGGIVHRCENAVRMENKNVIENEGRLQVKRLYAVLTNRKLRKKYFEF